MATKKVSRKFTCRDCGCTGEAKAVGRLPLRCSGCKAARKREYRSANAEKERGYSQKYREANREKIRERCRKYLAENPEKERERKRKYRQANREKVLEGKRKWYYNNREKALESNRKYREANPEKVRARLRKWKADNPEKVSEHNRKYREVNPEKEQERHRKYREANREKVRECIRRRRARKLAAYVADVTAEDVARMKAAQGGKCATIGCTAKLADGYHLDHVVPLAAGGTHEPANVQLLCPACNLSKGAKLPEDFAKQRGVLFA